MAITLAQKKSLASAHRALRLSTRTPPTYKTTDMFFLMGQSNMAATAANTTRPVTPSPALAVRGVMRSTQGDYTTRSLVVPGTSFFGQSTPAGAFGQTWYDLTGRQATFTPMCFAGTPLYSESGTPRWDPENLAESYIGLQEITTGYPQSALITQSEDTHLCDPALLSPGLKIALWCQGEADENRTKDQHKAALLRLIDHCTEVRGFDYFLIYAIGRKGLDATEATANEALRTNIRQAQIEACDERAKAVVILNTAKEFGSPFNTLTETSGVWSAGWAYGADGQHYTTEAYNVMGVTGARNAAFLLGLASGTPVGI